MARNFATCRQPADQAGTRISIIVPVLNEAANIAQFLAMLRSRGRETELIVVDGRSTDKTVENARGSCDRLLVTKPGRGPQMNAGAAVASGDILWFLHADVEPPDNCIELILQSLRDSEVVGGFFRIRLPSERLVYRLTDTFAHYAGLLLRMRFGDHGFFCRRKVFQQIGGYPDVSLLEDGEFFRKLRRTGPIAVIQRPMQVSPRRFERIGAVRLTISYGAIAALYALRFPLPMLLRIYRTTCCR